MVYYKVINNSVVYKVNDRTIYTFYLKSVHPNLRLFIVTELYKWFNKTNVFNLKERDILTKIIVIKDEVINMPDDIWHRIRTSRKNS